MEWMPTLKRKNEKQIQESTLNVAVVPSVGLEMDSIQRSAGLRNPLEPWSRAARKWRENAEMKRKWRENEEMKRKRRENEEMERD